MYKNKNNKEINKTYINNYINEFYIPPSSLIKSNACIKYSLPSNSVYKKIDLNELDNLIKQAKERSFSHKLINYIDRKGVPDKVIYKKAFIDRKLFSKIKNKYDYKPSKNTVIAFILALELNIEEANELLSSAGYSFSRSDYFDLIIMYFINIKYYDITDINDVLYDYKLNIIGY